MGNGRLGGNRRGGSAADRAGVLPGGRSTGLLAAARRSRGVGCELRRHARPEDAALAVPRLGARRWLARHTGGLVRALGDFLDQLAAERGYVVRLAARDDAAVDHHLLIDPFRAGVQQIGLERGPRRHRASLTAPTSMSVHGPWQMTPIGLPASTK